MRKLLILAACLLAGPAPAQNQSVPGNGPPTEVFTNLNDPDLFATFGGMEGLRLLMEEFERELLANPTTRPYLANRDLRRTKAQLVDQVCQILGGGCVYRGGTMRDFHRDMGINQADFLALVETFQKAMDRRGIPFRAQNRLNAVLAPMHRDIVTR